jgi:glucose 1-dehydrogenase
MSGRLEGKVAVVTGGSRGLGFAIARAFAQEGASVVLASRSSASVDRAAAELKSAGFKVAGFSCDVADLFRVEALADFAEAQFGPIGVWVNDAGLSAPYGPSAHVPSPIFRSVIDTNIVGTYNGSVVALRRMLPLGRGRLINILGRGDTGAIPLQNAYSSSKVWVRNFTRALAKEYEGSGVGIHAFNPGLVRTEMIGDVEAVRGWEGKLEPLRVVSAIWANEASVPAEKAVWLASDATEGRTGIMAKVLTTPSMLGGLVRAGGRIVSGKGLGASPMKVRVVEAAVGEGD